MFTSRCRQGGVRRLLLVLDDAHRPRVNFAPMSIKRGIVLLSAILIIGILLTGASLGLRNPRPRTLANLPTPNGYDALLQAGSLIQNNSSDFEKMSQEQSRAGERGNAIQRGANKNTQAYDSDRHPGVPTG